MPSPLPARLLRTRRFAQRRRRVVSALERQGFRLDKRQHELIQLLSRAISIPSVRATGGVYVYGPPGRGKSMLLDAFCADLDKTVTARYHFHEFFRAINSPAEHGQKQSLGSVFAQGLERELTGIKILLFDEFHCVEPGDAMFMAKLVKYCQEQEIFLVTTSNYEPEKLLDDEYFHHLALPTIELVRSTFSVFELDSAVDYRTLDAPAEMRREGYLAGTLNSGYSPIDESSFDSLIEIGYDQIGPARYRGSTIEISFDQLCRTRRNTADYLTLASQFTCWHITSVPASHNMPMDEERRFANLIDVFYDKDLEVHLYTQDRLEHLGHRLHDTERARLESRLAQLQYSEEATDRITK
ncbi:cell division protein ZapE [Glutamicibacter arilaitensis]|uniref:cell division protein ZapE n=1 Tax=Glutamicibacter arilaitensis TaxID=256701 RepID=UPI00384A92CB